MRRARVLVPFTVSALIAFSTIASSCTGDRAEDSSASSRLVAAAASHRFLEGRLTGGFTYKPVDTRTRNSSTDESFELLAVAGGLQKAATSSPTSENLHAWGVAQLLVGKYESGVDTLQAALLENATNARLMTDLGAGQLALASASGWPEALPRAAEVLEQAIALEPDLPAAWFTKAIVLERLYMPTQARQAWERYLQLDASPGWAEEARQRLTAVQVRGADVRWAELEKSLSSGVFTDEVVSEAVARYPVDVREMLVRDSLPAWAAASNAFETKQALVRITRIVERLEPAGHDQYFRSVVHEMSAAQGPRRAALSLAIRELATGLKAQAAERPSAEIRPHFEAAAAILRRRRSRLDLWAQLTLGRLASLQQQHEHARARLLFVVEHARRLKLPTLEARAQALLGMTAFTMSRWSDAAGHYDRAIRLSDMTGEEALAAGVHVNAAVLDRFLGNRRGTWEHRARAAATLSASRPLQVHGYLTSGAATASIEALPLAAVLFQNEVVANARAQLPAGPQTEAYISRARMLARVNRFVEAARDLDEAAGLMKAAQSEAMRSRFERAWLLASAEVRMPSDPARAANDASKAVSLITAAKEPIRLAEAALLESRARAGMRDFPAARAAADRGIAAFESGLRSIDARDPIRVAALEPVWALYAEAARLELVPGRENYAAAFEVSERGRARSQLDLQRVVPLGLEQVRQQLGPHQGIVMLDQSRSELVSWWITRDSVSVKRTPLPQIELERLVATHRRAVDQGQRRHPSSARLFDLAMRHCWEDLRKKQVVAVIADGAWNRVAWPTLWDSSSRTELVSFLAIVLAPSAAVAVSERPLRTLAGSALVVSAPAGDPNVLLPGAQAEAKEIAGIYPRWKLLEAAEASPARVLTMARDVDVLHVSSHAIDVPAYPQMSHLVLAGENRGAPLFVRDIAAVDMSHLSLAVLAACSTAGTTAVRGEGSVGIAWGFLTAGVRHVIATLQEIEDEPARRFFPKVHRLVVGGRPPAEALHTVQRELAAAGESPRVWGIVAIYGAL